MGSYSTRPVATLLWALQDCAAQLTAAPQQRDDCRAASKLGGRESDFEACHVVP